MFVFYKECVIHGTIPLYEWQYIALYASNLTEEKACVKNVWIFYRLMNTRGARGSVVGWGTMLQAGKSPIRVPDEVDFFNLLNPSSRTLALGSTQPLTEMSIRNLNGGNKRPARRADNLAVICEPNVWKYGSLNLS
jgi:hypothetical protein